MQETVDPSRSRRKVSSRVNLPSPTSALKAVPVQTPDGVDVQREAAAREQLAEDRQGKYRVVMSCHVALKDK